MVNWVVVFQELAFRSTTVDRPTQVLQYLCCLRAEMHGVVVSGLIGHYAQRACASGDGYRSRHISGPRTQAIMVFMNTVDAERDLSTDEKVHSHE